MSGLLRPTERMLRRYLVTDSPCLMCGDPTYNQAHRIVDALRDRYHGGETVTSIARDMNLPRTLVDWLCRSPITQLARIRRYKRRDAQARMDAALARCGAIEPSASSKE